MIQHVYLYFVRDDALLIDKIFLCNVEPAHAIGLDDKLAEGHFFLAEIHWRDLELDQAASHYETAIKGDEKMAKAMAGLAEVKLRKGGHSEAADLYARAIGLKAEPLRWWVRLGFIYETLEKNHQQALSTYKNLKWSIEQGKVRGRPEFDLGAKIKALEALVQPPVAAQASVDPELTGK